MTRKVLLSLMLVTMSFFVFAGTPLAHAQSNASCYGDGVGGTPGCDGHKNSECGGTHTIKEYLKFNDSMGQYAGQVQLYDSEGSGSCFAWWANVWSAGETFTVNGIIVSEEFLCDAPESYYSDQSVPLTLYSGQNASSYMTGDCGSVGGLCYNAHLDWTDKYGVYHAGVRTSNFCV